MSSGWIVAECIFAAMFIGGTAVATLFGSWHLLAREPRMKLGVTLYLVGEDEDDMVGSVIFTSEYEARQMIAGDIVPGLRVYAVPASLDIDGAKMLSRYTNDD